MHEWKEIRAGSEAARYKFALVAGELHVVDTHGTGPLVTLSEMLVEATGVDLTDDEAVADLDKALRTGAIVLGYFGGGEVEIHSSLTVPYPAVVAGIGNLFGRVRISAPEWTAETGSSGADDPRHHGDDDR